MAYVKQIKNTFISETKVRHVSGWVARPQVQYTRDLLSHSPVIPPFFNGVHLSNFCGKISV
jgi:hypothetical protein